MRCWHAPTRMSLACGTMLDLAVGTTWRLQNASRMLGPRVMKIREMGNAYSGAMLTYGIRVTTAVVIQVRSIDILMSFLSHASWVFMCYGFR